MTHTLYHGDCLEILAQLPDDSVDSMAADPPSGINFMNKHWDSDKGGRDAWIAWLSSIMKECLRVLKPGGHAAVWSLPRTSHWTGMALELSGFEVRDCISYLYDSGRDTQAFLETLSAEQRGLLEIILANGDDSFGAIAHVFGSGFPKSLDISKAIDKSAGMEREVVGRNGYESRRPRKEYEHTQKWGNTLGGIDTCNITAPASAEAKQWDGFGTALKPAAEYWWLVRKPLSEATIAENVLRHGCGGLNIDACRIPTGDDNFARPVNHNGLHEGWDRPWRHDEDALARERVKRDEMEIKAQQLGRFPSNVIHDGSEVVEAEFIKAGVRSSGAHKPIERSNSNGLIEFLSGCDTRIHSNGGNAQNSGSASRFFYCAKPSPSERNEGLDGFEEIEPNCYGEFNGTDKHAPNKQNKRANIHPTVKSVALMSHLIKLITPPNGTVLDPFMGSGTTIMAAIKGGFNGIGIEKEREYFEIAEARIRHAAMGQQGEIIAPVPLPERKPKLQLAMF